MAVWCKTGGAVTGGVTSYAFTDEEAPITTKFGVHLQVPYRCIRFRCC